eukprot:gb/GECG01004923.1/.p1 GENE.gb/GECG01004923.1/~~gb/GECG01004923.1/.p1  ORF type:complete len:528 (+),score=76.85 gb/GECG01004923.1/:1-1584(+)
MFRGGGGKRHRHSGGRGGAPQRTIEIVPDDNEEGTSRQYTEPQESNQSFTRRETKSSRPSRWSGVEQSQPQEVNKPKNTSFQRSNQGAHSSASKSDDKKGAYKVVKDEFGRDRKVPLDEQSGQQHGTNGDEGAPTTDIHRARSKERSRSPSRASERSRHSHRGSRSRSPFHLEDWDAHSRDYPKEGRRSDEGTFGALGGGYSRVQEYGRNEDYSKEERILPERERRSSRSRSPRRRESSRRQRSHSRSREARSRSASRSERSRSRSPRRRRMSRSPSHQQRDGRSHDRRSRRRDQESSPPRDRGRRRSNSNKYSDYPEQEHQQYEAEPKLAREPFPFESDTDRQVYKLDSGTGFFFDASRRFYYDARAKLYLDAVTGDYMCIDNNGYFAYWVPPLPLGPPPPPPPPVAWPPTQASSVSVSAAAVQNQQTAGSVAAQGTGDSQEASTSTSEAMAQETTTSTSTAPKATTESKLEHICFICRRGFATKQQLEKHERKSKLHKENLQKLQKTGDSVTSASTTATSTAQSS